MDLGISTLTPVVKDLGGMSWPVCFSSGHCRGLVYRRCVDLAFISRMFVSQWLMQWRSLLFNIALLRGNNWYTLKRAF